MTDTRRCRESLQAVAGCDRARCSTDPLPCHLRPGAMVLDLQREAPANMSTTRRIPKIGAKATLVSLVAALTLSCGAAPGAPSQPTVVTVQPQSGPAVVAAPNVVGARRPILARGDTVRFMPKDCEQGRVFMNLGELLPAEARTALAKLQAKLVHLDADEKGGVSRSARVLATLERNGIEPLFMVRELSVCAGADDKIIVALAFDFPSSGRQPAEVLAEAMEAGSGKPPTRTVDDGVVILSNDTDAALAFVTRSVVLVGKRDSLRALLQGGGGAEAFDADRDLTFWAKLKQPHAGGDSEIALRRAPTSYELRLLLPPPRADADAFARDPDAYVRKFGNGLEALSREYARGPFEGLGPVLKSAAVAKEGNRLLLTATFPIDAFTDVASAAASMDATGLLHALQ